MQIQESKKALALGIDTGGTYTDGVLLHVKKKQVVAKAKVHTTKEDLSLGIGKCIEALEISEKKDEVSMVCLSTTLATNSVVEGKISRVGLILMHREAVSEKFTVDIQHQVKGAINISGVVEEALDEDEVENILNNMKGKIDCLVVSGYLCVRNPIHEIRVKEIALQHLNVPVICAHELSMALGFSERTNTAVLNAHLMPVIRELIQKTKETLEKKQIYAPIMVLKGDGVMMLEEDALERPVETVLSGPAASVIGGSFLTDEQDALFVDLGGTTADIAYMENGSVAVAEDGATINGWKTKVRAADVHTFGLGGDSRLQIQGEAYSFGPLRAIPVCVAAVRHPGLIDEIKSYDAEKNTGFTGFHRAEALVLNKRCVDTNDLTEVENRIVELLSDGPHSILYVASKLTRFQRIMGFDNLVKKGIVDIISVTPTDLLHASGAYVQWDAAAAMEGVGIAARQLGLSPQEALKELMKKFFHQLTYVIIESSLRFDGNYNETVFAEKWLYHMLFQSMDSSKLRCVLNKKVIAIGAPAEAWLKGIEASLETEVIVPVHYEVANAIGAARGVLRGRLEVLIRHDTGSTSYRIHMPWGVAECKSFEAAQELAHMELEKQADVIEEKNSDYRYSRQWQEEKFFIGPEHEDSIPYEVHMILTMTAAAAIFQ